MIKNNSKKKESKNKLNLISKNIFSFDGTKISYVIDSNQKKQTKFPIIFLHGAGSNHSVWQNFFPFFLNRKIIALDFRNHGFSERGKISIENYAKDVLLVLKKEKITQAYFVGNSMSAAVIDCISKKNKKMVQKAVYLSPFAKKITRFSFLIKTASSLLYFPTRLFPLRKRRFVDYSTDRTLPSFLFPILDMKGTYLSDYLYSIYVLLNYELDLDSKNKNVKKNLVICGKSDIFLKQNQIQNKIILNGDHLVIRNEKRICKILQNFF